MWTKWRVDITIIDSDKSESTDVKSVKEFAGDIRLIMEEKEFVIDTNLIEPSTLLVLSKYELK